MVVVGLAPGLRALGLSRSPDVPSLRRSAMATAERVRIGTTCGGRISDFGLCLVYEEGLEGTTQGVLWRWTAKDVITRLRFTSMRRLSSLCMPLVKLLKFK